PPQQKPYKRRSSMNTGFKHPGFSKRRRRANSESDPVLPTNFLLGGNIFDPLNLNSLLDEEVNRALNAETPKSSPLPAKSRDPVEILIPKDITDPLNLNCAGGETGPLVGGGVASSCPTGAPYAVGSGVRGQPRRRQKGKFQYGNYNKYYGYRNPGWSEDPRVRWLRPEWFQGKAVLDLGCNTGHLTLEEAEQMQQTGEGEEAGKADESAGPLQPESEQPPAEKRAEGPAAREEGMEGEDAQKEGGERTEAVVCPAPSPSPVVKQQFPVSLRICRGPIAAPPLAQADASCPGDFPANVSFVTGNYVLQSDGALQAQQPEFDTILCLSVTKWVHLNWGDPGLQRLFQRAFRQLRPGGVFILEPQPWTSYGKRKKLTDAIYKNYYSIRLKPEQFSSYLTSPEVGFSSYELVGTPKTSSRGFQRPIYLFHKGPPSCRK
ncbi:MEPCE enzyme, partial [Amia calva]|nr:MEPCE enzyme [Amia calva]